MDTIDLGTFGTLASRDHGLCTFSTARPDGTVHSCVVNAGLLAHPVTDTTVVGLVSAGGTQKLRNLRADQRATIVARAGWEWAAVEGTAEIIGPDDAHAALDGEALRMLFREVFGAAGGTHDDWDAYDRVMRDDRRAAVLVTPRRTYGNTQTT